MNPIMRANVPIVCKDITLKNTKPMTTKTLIKGAIMAHLLL